MRHVAGSAADVEDCGGVVGVRVEDVVVHELVECRGLLFEALVLGYTGLRMY